MFATYVHRRQHLGLCPPLPASVPSFPTPSAKPWHHWIGFLCCVTLFRKSLPPPPLPACSYPSITYKAPGADLEDGSVWVCLPKYHGCNMSVIVHRTGEPNGALNVCK